MRRRVRGGISVGRSKIGKGGRGERTGETGGERGTTWPAAFAAGFGHQWSWITPSPRILLGEVKVISKRLSSKQPELLSL